ncbi:DUF6249 domain-containing protein [Porphyromonas gulae]|uniref:DUF6249 domain-containing protein n=1 Tax=Porphyromonas gulae TaxID=111105 RepID=UPI00052BC696|nr:DUF6249 domain-containing protein [Porphyromonas gulae]KGN89507.1 hypothetical protein HQ46_04280 [Porphyromonas gulae]KGO02206.1 hypothetical protein HQ42_08455 [Porphyromonas gulae]
MNLESILVPAVVFYFIFKIFELYVRRGERLRLIEKLDSLPSDTEKEELNRLTSSFHSADKHSLAIKAASMFVGMGIGMLTAFFLTFVFQRAIENLDGWNFGYTFETLSATCLLIFGGLGLLIPSIIMRKGEKDKQ